MQDAMQEKKGRSGTKDTKKDDAEKKDLPKPPIIVAVVQPTPPPPPVASFGLPSGGVEPGSSTDGSSSKPSAVEQASIDTPTPDTSAKLTVNPPMPPAETVQPDKKTELAFAVRLADLTPNREVKVADLTPKIETHLAQATQQPDQKMDLTFALTPAVTLQAPSSLRRRPCYPLQMPIPP